MVKCDSTLDKPASLGSVEGEALVPFQNLSVLVDAIVACFEMRGRPPPAIAMELDSLWLDRLKRKVVKGLPGTTSSMVIGSRNRLRCSAAEGLHSLAVRENSQVVDRIAILGNLCNFQVRQDTGKLESGGYSFSTAAFALAALNGDLSLMSCLPASRQLTKEAAMSLSVPHRMGVPHLGYSWGPPLDGTLTNIEWVFEDSNPKRLAQCEFTEEGLSTFGWVFVCDLIIDVSPLQTAYKEEWERSTSSSKSDIDKLCIRIVWSLIRLLIHKGYLHLAQVVWSGENDLRVASSDETFNVPMDIRELIDPKTHAFIFRNSTMRSEQQFLDSLLPAEETVSNIPSYDRTWLAQTVMNNGKIVCGRQVNTGISLPPAHAMMSFSTENGKVDIKPGFEPPKSNTSNVQEPQAEDLVPGTTVPKSKYLSVFQSEAAFKKCVFTPALQHALEGRSPHTWRPQHWIANRTFKGSAGDLWKIEGGEVIRGFVVPQGMFSRCVLV